MSSDGSIYGARAKKRLSQSFLVDANIAAKIVSLARLGAEDEVIEVGPGRGVLTGLIAESKAHLTCIELDPGLSAVITERFAGDDRVVVIHADALKYSFTEHRRCARKKIKLISNLPYHISGPMLAKLLDEHDAFGFMVLMFQKEVARRIAAQPGTKAYGVLSVLTRAYMSAHIEFDIPASVFRPVPKVDSSVVSFTPLERALVGLDESALFKRVVKSAFSQRRKTLSNALKTLPFERERVSKALKAADIDPSRRGETLDLDEFIRLVRLLKEGA